MASRRKPNYTGVLAAPIKWPANYLLRMMRSDKTEEFLANQLYDRITALYEHYGIKPRRGSGLSLALALAKDNVKGFAFADPVYTRGRPRRGSEDLDLCIEILKRGSNRIHETCGHIGKRKGIKTATIRSRFYEAMKDPDIAAKAKAAAAAIARAPRMISQKPVGKS